MELFSAHGCVNALLEGVTRKLSGRVSGFVFGRLKTGFWQTRTSGRPDHILGKRKLQPAGWGWGVRDGSGVGGAEGLASGLGQRGLGFPTATQGLCCFPGLTCHLLRSCVSDKQDFLNGERLR